MNSTQNITPKEWDLIETWIEQKDVQGEASLLENEFAQIPNILQKIEYVKKVGEEIEDSIRQLKIKEFHKLTRAEEEDSEIKDTTNKKIRSNTVWLTIAAAIALLFCIFWMMDHSTTPEKIFANNFKADIGLPLKMSKTSELSFYEGMLDYKQENYTEAIVKWQILLESKPENDTLNYFLGVTHLALGNATKSLKYLKTQNRFQQGIFKEDAAWYAALASIKEGKFEEAKVFLDNYPSTRNNKLLKKLDK